MKHLMSRQIGSLMQCIQAIYSCTDFDEFPRNTLSALSRIIRCSGVTFDEVDLKKQKLTHHELPSGYLLEKDLPVVERYIHEHPYINLLYPASPRPYQFQRHIEKAAQRQLPSLQQSSLGRAVKISDLLTDRQFQRLALYNEFYRKYDIEYQMLMQVCGDDSITTGITFNRDKRDFSEQERLLLNLLGPHVVQAYNNAKAISVSRNETATWAVFGEKAKSKLTARESEVLFWVAQGKTNAGVAAILNLSSGTIRIHLEHIYAKLGVNNRTEASILAVEKFELTGGG